MGSDQGGRRRKTSVWTGEILEVAMLVGEAPGSGDEAARIRYRRIYNLD